MTASLYQLGVSKTKLQLFFKTFLETNKFSLFIINHLHLSFPLYYSTTDGHRSTSSRRSVSVQMTTPNIEELELQDLQLLLPDFCITLHKTLINHVDKSNNR